VTARTCILPFSLLHTDLLAVSPTVLTAAYHMLKNGDLYQDLGANHFDNRAKGKQVMRLVNRLQNLGFGVQIKPIAA